MLYPDQPTAAYTSLRQTLTRLRKGLCEHITEDVSTT